MVPQMLIVSMRRYMVYVEKRISLTMVVTIDFKGSTQLVIVINNGSEWDFADR